MQNPLISRRNLVRSLSISGLIGFVAFAGLGCPKGETPETGAPAVNKKTSGATGAMSGKKLIIAVIPKGVTHSFWQTIRAGAEKAAEENNAEIRFVAPSVETDIIGQKTIIDAQIANKVDAIVLAAIDAKGLASAVVKAQNAGIPVITIDSAIDPDTSVKFVATDNIKGGASAADAIAKLLPEGGEIGVIPFVKGAGSSDDRENGFKEQLKKYPNLKIVSTLYSESDTGKGQEVTNAMIAANPNLKAIFAANQAGGIGAAQAIKQKNLKDKIKIVAYDAGDEEIAALKDGIVQALIVQQPIEMGYLRVKEAVAAIQSKTVKSDKPTIVDTGVTVVTMENFKDEKIQKLLYPTGAKK